MPLAINFQAASLSIDNISLYSFTEPWTSWVRELGYLQGNWGRKLAVICADPTCPAAQNINNWYLTMSEHSIF